MALAAAVTVALALVASTGGDRLLLCRPLLRGDAALARGEAVGDAARGLDGRFLDYGVACEDAPEAARAARRAGLGHAIAATAEGRSEGSRFQLVLTDAGSEAIRARREVDVAPGADAIRPLRAALQDLLGALPPPPGPSRGRVAAWSLAGAGAVALAAGTVLAFQARDAADRANGAAAPGSYTSARKDWREKRAWSGAALATGTALTAAGLAWRFAF